MTGLMRLCPSWRSNRTKGLCPGGMRIDRSEMLWHPARGNNQGDPRGVRGKIVHRSVWGCQWRGLWSSSLNV